MLDLRHFICVCACCFTACFQVIGNPILYSRPIVTLIHEDPETTMEDYAFKIQGEFDIKELVRLIVQLRDYVVSTGGYFPRLTAFLEVCRVTMIKEGLEINDEAFDALWAEFARYEESEGFPPHQIKHHHKHKHKKDKEFKISSKMCTGFLKFVGGSLLCLIPVPAIQGAGASLAIIGVSEMMDSARQESDKKEIEERMDANRRIENGMDQR